MHGTRVSTGRHGGHEGSGAGAGRIADQPQASRSSHAKETSFEDVDLHRVVAGAIAAQSQLIVDTGAMVSVGKLPTVHADRAQLGQLFRNLIRLCIELSQPAAPRISILCHRVHGRPVVTVSDNGHGIGAAHYPLVSRILRGHHETESEPEPLVILADGERIMQRHGGHLGLESVVGQGTVISLHFASK